MRRFWIGMLAVAMIGVFASEVWCGNMPNFNNPESVLKDIRTKIDACSQARSRDCMIKCGYAIKTLKNFLKANPGGDPSILKQRWQPCFEAHRDANLPGAPAAAASEAVAPAKKTEKPTIDRTKFVVSGLLLGGDMNSQKDRFFLLEADGYHKKTKLEHRDIILQKGVSKPGPDIIKNYKGSIKEAPVYVHFEATADGRVYMIQFEQKEDMDVAAVETALVKRYGNPTKHHGHYLYWGCEQGPQKGFCVKANVSSRSLTIWASDEDIKAAAHKKYRESVLKAKGVKSGAKF